MICDKCNRKIADDSQFCRHCGARTENVEEMISSDIITESAELDLPDLENVTSRVTPDEIIEMRAEEATKDLEEPNNEEDVKQAAEVLATQKKSQTKKIIISSLLGIVILAGVILLGLFFLKQRVIPLDINEVKGCPEFYNLKWGMSSEDADKQIEIRHTLFRPHLKIDEDTMEFTYDTNAAILFYDQESFCVYNKNIKDVLLSFDGNFLEGAVLIFSKDDYSFEEIFKLYKKIYGQPTGTDEEFAIWEGISTNISIFNFTADDGEEIVVMYEGGRNTKYTALVFDGTEIDPCGFLGENYVFDKEPDYYLKGLEEGEDYNKKEYSTEGFGGFTQYTLFPAFEYMGIDAGKTGIQFSQDASEECIGVVGYNFLLDEDNVCDRMNYIHAKLMEKYGEPSDVAYTPLEYSKIGIYDLTFQEMLQKISKNTEGIYNIQWHQGKRNITLTLTLRNGKEYFEGSVSFSD